VLLLLFLALILPGSGWVFFGIFKVLLLLWIIACVAGVFAVARFRRRVRRHMQSGWNRQSWGGPFWGGGTWGGSTRSSQWHDDADD
jgi:hypothetical protein